MAGTDDAIVIARAERFVARYEYAGRKVTSSDAAEMLKLLAQVLKIAKKPCERCAWIEKEYDGEVIA